MQEKSKKPAIRFAGFTEDWEQRKLSDLYEKVSKKNDLSYGKESIISVANMYYKEDSYITDESYLLTYNIFELGDIAFEGNKSKNYAHGRFVENTIGNGIVSHVFDVFRPIMREYDLQFWKYYINNENVMGDILVRSTKASTMMTNLVANDFLSESLHIPCYEEQRNIGSFLNSLDHLITLHQRKYSRLVNIKKSMLEKMFPKPGADAPEIRFAGFTDAWEQRKWSETVDISKEMVDPKSGEYDNLPHVAPGNMESFTGQLYDNVKSVKEENLISGKFHFYPGDIIYGKINPQLGKYHFSSFEGLTSADAYVLNAKNGVAQKYLFAILQTSDFFDYSVSVSKRSGMPKINRDELNAYSFFAPCINEQIKIGEYLLSLDHLITLHQRKLEKLQNIKKSCLEKMFV